MPPGVQDVLKFNNRFSTKFKFSTRPDNNQRLMDLNCTQGREEGEERGRERDRERVVVRSLRLHCCTLERCG